jgi:hypothetical protein
MKRFLLLPILLAAQVGAHIGSPDAFFEGDAGPYHLFVTIRKPPVVPGVAEFELRSRADDIKDVRIALGDAEQFDENLLPVPDQAIQSKTDPQFFSTGIWLMAPGPMIAKVRLDGTKGKAEIAIPFTSYAQRVLPLGRASGTALFGLMMFLAAGIVAIVSAGVREGFLDPGAKPAPGQVQRTRTAVAATAILVTGIVMAGNRWWGAEALAYRGEVDFFRPPKLEAVLDDSHRLVLHVVGQHPRWARYAHHIPLVRDHSHFMHLFLMRVPDLDRMWHLHPERSDGGEFTVGLPALERGRYHLFADIVDKNGFPWTAFGDIDLPGIGTSDSPRDPDDSGWSGTQLSSTDGAPGMVSALSGGARMVWLPTPQRVGVATQFRFRVETREGRPVQDMEPYMGMAGHAEFVRSDLAVFAHIHPAGTAPMAALAMLQNAGTAPAAMAHAGMTMPEAGLPPDVSFPYAFPSPGRYRIFVQIKRSGKVETGVFDASVN